MQVVAFADVHVRETDDPAATVMGPSELFALMSAVGALRDTDADADAESQSDEPEQEIE